MFIHRIAHCRVMKGCGPEWVDKIVEVFIDDLDTNTSDSEINEMVRQDIKSQLSGFTHFTIGDIFPA